jgi:predicted DsbA family dithiol-disulfide isomerase
MKVEIWSDIACPWCYIGRRRFEKALNQFEHRGQVDVIWRSYQLDPKAPRDYPGSVNDMLMKRYGMSLEKAQSANDRVTDLAALEGLEYHLDRAHPVNSLDAHRLIHLAAQHNLQGAMKERLQKAYFTEGAVVSDHDTLIKLAGEVGLDLGETRAMLEGDSLVEEVHEDEERANQLGIDGVPFFFFDENTSVYGAQPVEVFTAALENAWGNSK